MAPGWGAFSSGETEGRTRNSHGLLRAPGPLGSLLWKVFACCLLVLKVLYVPALSGARPLRATNTHA